jgi:hypothetical protein
MQNKVDHVNRILRLMDRYPQMTVKELLYLIECRTEGEKIFYFLLSLVGTYASRNL